MKRVFLLVLDSFGIGASLDAVAYGDAGADTLGHIAERCANGQADKAGVRQGPLRLPNLTRFGLPMAALASTGKPVAGLARDVDITAVYGYAVESGCGKDTPSGHWEIAGIPVQYAWGHFAADYPSCPDQLISELCKRAQLPGILGNKHASGTDIIAELGEEHLKTGKPIVYISADSVFQIAAHEKNFGLERLYQVCEIARELVDEYYIARVIARPFLGTAGNFYRTANRRDLAIPPPEATLLDYLITAGGSVIAVGKVADIFAQRGISKKIAAADNRAVFDTVLDQVKHAPDYSLTFANLSDFDTLYGHRRNVIGYATALEAFDARLPELEAKLRNDDMVIITADHGCDPTRPGSDHTREHVPILMFGPTLKPRFIGRRDSFADIGQTIAKYFDLKPLPYGLEF